MVAEREFLMWLFEETRRFATQLDGLVSAVVRDDTMVGDYREFLVRTLGFEAPLEAALAYTPGLSAVCELRARSGRIVHDLLALGMRPQQIANLPQCSIAPFATVAAGLGWLYVHERSRLQHPLLCARIRERLPEAKDASDYFCRDEIDLAKRWDLVASALERFAATSASAQKIRAGACEAFQIATAWYSDEPLRVAQ